VYIWRCNTRASFLWGFIFLAMYDRKVFKFYKSYYDVFKELDNKNKLDFINALFERQFFGKEPINLTGMAKFAYISQKFNIDSQVNGFQDKTGINLTELPPIIPPITPPTAQIEIELKEKEEIEKKEKIQIIDSIYKLYPSNCPKRKSSTGKSVKDKIKIESILKTKTAFELENIIKNYITDCEKSGTYLKNFATFLNQLPEIEIIPEVIPEKQITYRREGCLDIKVPISKWQATKKMYGIQIIWSDELEILGKEIQV